MFPVDVLISFMVAFGIRGAALIGPCIRTACGVVWRVMVVGRGPGDTMRTCVRLPMLVNVGTTGRT